MLSMEGSNFVRENEAREDYKMAQNPRQKGGTNIVEAYLSLSLFFLYRFLYYLEREWFDLILYLELSIRGIK